MTENGADGLRVGEEGEDTHVGAALGAAEREDLVDTAEELGPAGAGGSTGEGHGRLVVDVFPSLLTVGFVCGGTVVVAEGEDLGPEPRVGGQDAVIAVAVYPGRRDEAGEGFQEFEGRGGEEGAAVGGATGGW